MTIHHVFLSHTGRQKDFVEQLRDNLQRREYTCFFDKEPQSLAKGENFNHRIFKAARDCRVTVVLLTEDYFNSKWPMLELAAFVDAQASTNPDLQILPLWFYISPKDIDASHRKEWHNKWKEWEGQSGVNVDKWNLALDAIRPINGLNFKKDMGEVYYRSEVEDAVDNLLRNMSERCKYVLVGTSFALYKNHLKKEEEYREERDAAYKTGILRRKAPSELLEFIKSLPLLKKPSWKALVGLILRMSWHMVASQASSSRPNLCRAERKGPSLRAGWMHRRDGSQLQNSQREEVRLGRGFCLRRSGS